jgi:hypothetical protein
MYRKTGFEWIKPTRTSRVTEFCSSCEKRSLGLMQARSRCCQRSPDILELMR